MASPRIIRTLPRLASYSRKVHLSSSNLLVTIKCHFKKRRLHRTEYQQIQLRTYLLVQIRINPTTVIWTSSSQTVAHQQKYRTKWSVCTRKSIFTTFNWCKMVKLLDKKRPVTTTPSSQTNCKKLLGAISDRCRHKIFLILICPWKTQRWGIPLARMPSAVQSIHRGSNLALNCRTGEIWMKTLKL